MHLPLKKTILRWNLLFGSLLAAAYAMAGEAKPDPKKATKNPPPTNPPAVAQPPDLKFDTPLAILPATAGAQQTEVNALADRSGRVHVVWIEDANKKRALYYAQLDPKTKEFTAPIKVRDPKGNLRSGAQVRFDDAGAVFVVWAETASGATQDSEVWLALSTDGGKTFSALQVSDSPKPGSSRHFPALAFDRGRACLVYVESLGGNKGAQLQFRLSLNGGRDFDKSVTLVGVVNECAPVMAVGPKYMVALYRLGQGFMQNDIALRASADGGSNFSGNNMGAMRVSVDNWKFNRPADSGPQTIFDKKDQLHVVWFSNGDVFYSHSFFRDNGTHFTPRKAIHAPKTGLQTLPAVALDSDDHVIVAWQATNDKEKRTHLYLKQSKDEGNSFSGPLEVPLATATANPNFGPVPCLFVAADNAVCLAWTETEAATKQQRAYLARATTTAPAAPPKPASSNDGKDGK